MSSYISKEHIMDKQYGTNLCKIVYFDEESVMERSVWTGKLVLALVAFSRV